MAVRAAEEAAPVAANLSKVNPKLRTIARNLPRVALANGFEVRVTSGYRTYKQQAKLYADYINGVAQYPANPPGTSEHEKGLALDILSTDTAKLVGLLQSVGLTWAGWGDPIHFQIGSGGLSGAFVAPGQKIPKQKAATESFGTSFLKSAKSIIDLIF